MRDDYGASWPEVEIIQAQKTRDCGNAKPLLWIHDGCGKWVDITPLRIGEPHDWGTKTLNINCPVCGDKWGIKHF